MKTERKRLNDGISINVPMLEQFKNILKVFRLPNIGNFLRTLSGKERAATAAWPGL